MAAYVIVDAEILDAERAGGEYRALAESSIALYGGRYHVQGTVPEAAEGTWPPFRIVTVVEFPDMDRIKQWYTSAEYERAKAVRHGAMEARMLFVEGRPE